MNNRMRNYDKNEALAAFWDQMPQPGWHYHAGKVTDWKMDKVVKLISSRLDLTPLLIDKTESVYKLPGGVVYILVDDYHKRVIWQIGACSEQVLNRYRKAFKGIPSPRPLPEHPGSIYMNYTLRSDNGSARTFQRKIDAPDWKDIQENYTLEVSRKLTEIMTGTPDEIKGGRICILRGQAGTGKTTILRSLAAEWRTLAQFSYIMDLDHFFSDPAYMLDVLLSGGPYDEDQWHVILCEDAEKYINHRVKVGNDALATLLNLGDGMLGQGLKIMFLFTTNAEETDIDPAILRPGRCFLNLEVPELSAAEAAKWASTHGIHLPVHEPMTLAQLYNLGAT